MIQELEGTKCKVYTSQDARSHWRDVLDTTTGGGDVVVERNGKPIAAVIPFADYMALIEELEDLRDAREAEEAYTRWQRDPSTGTSYRQARAEMVSKGLLSEQSNTPI